MDDNNLYWDSNMADNIATPSLRDTSLANPDNVVSGYPYRDAETQEVFIGEMPLNPDLQIKLTYNEMYRIPKGYHTGKSVIVVEDLGDVTIGTATAADIAFNKSAWVNGVRVVGELNINKNNMAATATENDILEGETAWVNNELITGIVPKLLRHDISLNAGESYTVPEGYHGGTDIISAKSLSEQTPGNATEESITAGKTAWVDGHLIIGTNPPLLDVLASSSAGATDIRIGKTAYIAVGKIEGSMPEYIAQPTKKILCGESYTVPEGYHDGLFRIQAESLSNQTSATATVNDIRRDKTAWVNGILLTGIMDQVISPDTQATATENDILIGKTAWSNGSLLIGTCPYTDVTYHEHETNKYDPSMPAIFTLPEHNWGYVNYIDIYIFSTINNSLVNYFHFEKYESGSFEEGKDLSGTNTLITIESTIGSPKITFTSLIPDTYIDAICSNYNYLNY